MASRLGHKRDSQVELYSRTLDAVTELTALLEPIRITSNLSLTAKSSAGATAAPHSHELQQRLGPANKIDLFTVHNFVSYVALRP